MIYLSFLHNKLKTLENKINLLLINFIDMWTYFMMFHLRKNYVTCCFMNFIILLLDTLYPCEVSKKENGLHVRMAYGQWQHNYFCSATSLNSPIKIVVNCRKSWTCSLHIWTSLWWGAEKGLFVPLKRMQFLENSPIIYFIDCSEICAHMC